LGTVCFFFLFGAREGRRGDDRLGFGRGSLPFRSFASSGVFWCVFVRTSVVIRICLVLGILGSDLGVKDSHKNAREGYRSVSRQPPASPSRRRLCFPPRRVSPSAPRLTSSHSSAHHDSQPKRALLADSCWLHPVVSRNAIGIASLKTKGHQREKKDKKQGGGAQKEREKQRAGEHKTQKNSRRNKEKTQQKQEKRVQKNTEKRGGDEGRKRGKRRKKKKGGRKEKKGKKTSQTCSAHSGKRKRGRSFRRFAGTLAAMGWRYVFALLVTVELAAANQSMRSRKKRWGNHSKLVSPSWPSTGAGVTAGARPLRGPTPCRRRARRIRLPLRFTSTSRPPTQPLTWCV
jgi:hypothetical protein